MYASGEFAVDERGRRCFVPEAPRFPLLEEVYHELTTADLAVREFAAALEQFPVKGVLGRLFARLDAVFSSGAEGTTTTFSELMDYAAGATHRFNPDAPEVMAAAEAFDDLVDGPPGRPIAEADLLRVVQGIHLHLFANSKKIEDQMAEPGTFKRVINGIPDRDEHGGFFYFTPVARMETKLNEWGAFVLEQDGSPELLRQVLAHWMFEHIHPLHNGNGRAGRLLIPVILSAKGHFSQPCAFVGEAVSADKDHYVDALKQARREGDWTWFSRLMLSFMRRTAQDNLGRLQGLGTNLALWKTETAGYRSHSAIHALVPWLVTHPKFTISDAMIGAERGNHVSVSKAVKELVEIGIVRPTEDEGRSTVYAVPAIIDLFSKPSDGPAPQPTFAPAPSPRPRGR